MSHQNYLTNSNEYLPLMSMECYIHHKPSCGSDPLHFLAGRRLNKAFSFVLVYLDCACVCLLLISTTFVCMCM